MTAANEQNQRIIDEFRANAGKVGGYFAGTPLLLLTTTGAKSGKRTVSPVAGCVRNGTTGAAGTCGGRREGGPGGGQAAASSAMMVAQRSWNMRRRSPSETASPARATGRKYWRCSAKPAQKRAAEVTVPNPRSG